MRVRNTDVMWAKKSPTYTFPFLIYLPFSTFFISELQPQPLPYTLFSLADNNTDVFWIRFAYCYLLRHIIYTISHVCLSFTYTSDNANSFCILSDTHSILTSKKCVKNFAWYSIYCEHFCFRTFFMFFFSISWKMTTTFAWSCHHRKQHQSKHWNSPEGEKIVAVADLLLLSFLKVERINGMHTHKESCEWFICLGLTNASHGKKIVHIRSTNGSARVNGAMLSDENIDESVKVCEDHHQLVLWLRCRRKVCILHTNGKHECWITYKNASRE